MKKELNNTPSPVKPAIDPQQKNFDNKFRQRRLSQFTYQLFELTKRERDFIVLIVCLMLISAIAAPYPLFARWFGFMLASYSTIANDSIQALGTFIASNAKKMVVPVAIHRRDFYSYGYL